MTAAQTPIALVTVVMPVHNGEGTLRQSVVSVLDQTHRDLELLVVDDGSTDSTAEIVTDTAARDPRVRLIRRSRSGGPAVARNTGIAEARGRFLAFCDADDLWLPEKLARQLELAESSGAPLLYCGYHRVDSDYAGAGAEFVPEGREVSVPVRLAHEDLLRGNAIGNLTAVVDLERTGPVAMPDVQGAEDWALWLQITRRHGPAAGIPEPLALYRADQPGSHSANRWRALRAVWEVLRSQERLPRARAARHLVINALGALRKSRI